jgi:hypothetical protein
MQPLGLCLSGVGVGDLAEMGDHLPQRRWVQPGGGLQQHRFGLGCGGGGEVVGGVGQRGGVGDRQLPGGQRPPGPHKRTAKQRPGGADPAATGAATGPKATPQPAGGGGRMAAVVGAGGTAAVHARQLP